MTNAATNTPAGKHAQLALHLRTTGSGVGPHLEIGDQIPQPQRKKRGPKAGRKAALAMAAAAAAASATASAGPGCWPTADAPQGSAHLAGHPDSDLPAQLANGRRHQTHDPYAFHCDSSMAFGNQYGSGDSINDRRQVSGGC